MSKIGIIGATGSVGRELQKLLQNIAHTNFSSKDELDQETLESYNYLFFCTPNAISKKWIPLLKNPTIIDLSSAFRNDVNIPLIIPEINGHLLDKKPKIIASPNCTTTLMLLPLAPLHKKYGIKRIIVTTYQAASGAGQKALDELENATDAFLKKETFKQEHFPENLAFNLFLHPDEEPKMASETKKILDDSSIQTSATCVRVPTIRAHALSVNVELKKEADYTTCLELVKNAPGIEYIENFQTLTPEFAREKKRVFVSRFRQDPSQKNSFECWIVGDQLLKGAALNALQCFEKLYTTPVPITRQPPLLHST